MKTPLTASFLAEWQRQEAVLMAWPHQDTDWAPWLNEIASSYVELTAAISRSATALILCKDATHQAQIESLLGTELSQKVRFFQGAYDDTWCRDYGPITLGINGEPSRLLNFQFTGWGNKYEASSDNEVNNRLDQAEAWNIPLQEIPFDLEGGAIETDGLGTLLTTEACLFAGNRNPGMDKPEVERKLQETLGIDRVVWFQHGELIGDDTDSHVDNLVRFANKDTLIYAACRNEDDVHFEPLKAMEQEVKALKKQDGSAYQSIALEIPEAKYDSNGSRLPASYVNFLILNQTVIVPTFNSPMDKRAIENLSKALPDYEIIAVNGLHLIKQYGGPHCATMQIPQGSLQAPFIMPGESHD